MENNFLKKLSEVLASKNALVNIISLVALAFAANGIVLNGTPEEIYNMFAGQSGTGLLITLALNFLNPLSKLVKKFIDKTWDWSWVKSQNFITQAFSLVALILGAFLDQELASIVMVLVMQLWNLIVHLTRPPKEPTGEGNQVTDPKTD